MHSPVINVGIGIWLYSPWAFGRGDTSRYYAFWLWLAFTVVQATLSYVFNKWIPQEPAFPSKEKAEEEPTELKETSGFKEEPSKEEPTTEEESLIEEAEKEKPPKKEPSKVQ